MRICTLMNTPITIRQCHSLHFWMHDEKEYSHACQLHRNHQKWNIKIKSKNQNFRVSYLTQKFKNYSRNLSLAFPNSVLPQMYSAFFWWQFSIIKMQWLKNRKTIEQLLEKPYGQYVITLFVLTLFLHQLNIYVFNRIEESNVIGDVQFFRFFYHFLTF